MRSIIIWTTIAFWILIWCPICIYFITKYYKYRQNMAIRQRNYEIVMLICYIFLFEFCIDRPIALIDDGFSSSPLILHVIHNVLFIFTIHGIKLSLIWRYFSIYFDMNFVYSLSSTAWKSIISKKYDENNNWFMKNKTSFGNLKWQFKRILFLWIIISFIASIVRFGYLFNIYSETIASIFNGFIICLYAPAMFYFYKKIPNIPNDPFFIKKEMVYIFKIFSFQFFLYFISILMQSVMHLNDFIVQYFWSMTGMISASLYIYFLTIYILNNTCLNNKDNNLIQEQLYLTAVNSLSSNASSNRSNRSNSLPKLMKNGSSLTEQQPQTPKIIDLFEMLNDDRGYQLFMAHLNQELSHECLLSFTEMVQWKTMINSKLNVHIYSLPSHTGHKTKDILLFNLPSIVPLSSLVSPMLDSNTDNTDNNTDINMDRVYSNEYDDQYQDIIKFMKKAKISAYGIFQKYIYNNGYNQCPFEINISYLQRDPLIEYMKDYDSWMEHQIDYRTLFTIFDECIIEMFDLMNISFTERFKATTEYSQFENIHLNF